MEEQQEIWVAAVDFPAYMISSYGRIKALAKTVNHKNICTRNIDEKILKQQYDKHGYKVVCIWRDGKKHLKKIHRIVAQSFIPNPENKPVVNHLDCQKSNNHLSNLEWTTISGNTKHAFENNLIDRNRLSKINKGKISPSRKIVVNMETGIFYDMVKDAATAHGISEFTLGDRLRGTKKNHTPFIYA